MGQETKKRKEYESRGFLLKQRAFLKLYLFRMLENQVEYGNGLLEALRREFRSYGYSPTHSELYKVLHEFYRDDLVTREKKLKGEPGIDFQEIILYRLTDKGKAEAELYRKQMKVELERCRGLLDKALADNYD